MRNYLTAVCSGKNPDELEVAINKSIRLEEQASEGQLVEVINVSLSSCYDFKEGNLVHTAVVLWSYVPLRDKP